MNNTSHKINNPFIIIKNQIRRKIVSFLYPELENFMNDYWNRLDKDYSKILNKHDKIFDKWCKKNYGEYFK